MGGKFSLAKYLITETTYWDLKIVEPGTVIEVDDGQLPGRTWQPFGPGPHRKWEKLPPREPTKKDLDWK